MRKKKVLIVDGMIEFRQLLVLYLTEFFEVEAVSSGMQALALLHTGFMPDIILSDLVIPDADRTWLLKELHSNEAFRNIPVMILSSLDKNFEKNELHENVACDYLKKPFSPEELKIRMEKIMN